MAMAAAVCAVLAGTGEARGSACLDEVTASPYAPRLQEWRTAWAERGIAVSASYAGEVFANLAGGLEEAVTYDGLLDLAVDADLERLAGWKGLCFHANAFQIHGQSITAEGTGGLAAASSIEADPATRLSEIWLEQSLFSGRASVRFGQLAADTEFMTTSASDYLLNATWGWPTITAFDTPEGGPAYPMAAPGVRLAVRPSEHFDFKIAAFNGRVAEDCIGQDPQLCNLHGVEFPLGDPPLVMGEMTMRYELGDGLPGAFKLGSWHHSGDVSDVRFDAGGNLITITGRSGAPLDGDYGLYALLQQTVWKPKGAEGDQGITLFSRVMGAPEDHNFIDFYGEAGVIFAGLIPARPDDAVAFGFEYTEISERAVASEVVSGAEAGRSYESLAELTYTLSLRDAWTLQTSLQYLWRPRGGYTYSHPRNPQRLEDSLVIGTRSVWSF
ncbi:carbohydrate porin [Methyloligella solikamskensis]|uniref:Carbohydrate porin n=1 Tax=Methyloligella solikamskensis TaxID=1177756 RepID=A0ABW3JEH5_9HYPH